jgi:hypothetical protein
MTPRQEASRYLVAGIGTAAAVAATIAVLSILARGT